MKHSRFLCVWALAALMTGTLCAQTETVDRTKFPDYTTNIKADYSLMQPKTTTQEQRPAVVNNLLTKYFPPIFNQAGGSCGSASRIGYMFTYEINRLRGVDATLPENQYPTHFTWLLTNNGSGKEGMAMANGIPNAVTYGGSTYSSLFGNQDCSDSDYGWMQGYDKWYSAMFNRIERNANFPISVETEEGREAVKNWIWNHNGDPRYPGGGVCGIGVASSSMVIDYIPSTPANDAIRDRVSTRYVAKWGPQVDHALTIVGYDDRMEFDLDGNGIVGEKDKDEVGAWIIVNSWGPWWYNSGIVYCPYKNAVPSASSTSYYKPEIYYPRVDYRPLRTLKILMEYTRRSELKLSAGIAADISAETPEKTVAFEHFKYAGDGKNLTVAPEVPMLGRWADGELHHEPMEFGYDLTDLSANFDIRKPLKYFFIIESKGNAIGTGKVHSCSLMDYEVDRQGIERAFDIDDNGVTIQNAGNKTVLSVVVTPEPINKPRNVELVGTRLSWDAPVLSPYTVSGYAIYVDGELKEVVAADVFTYNATDAGSYQVAAQYEYGGDTFLSGRVLAPRGTFYGVSPESNLARKLTNSGIRIKDIFKQRYDQATIEYWIKPTSINGSNQQIGPGWGQFLISVTAGRELCAGWSENSSVKSARSAIGSSKWQHVAVVVDGNHITAYVNGKNVGEVSGTQSGIGGFGDFDFGRGGTTGINGDIDEVRIWSVARTEREIQSMMHSEVADPANTPGLLVELRMDGVNGTGLTPPEDMTGRHTTEFILNNGNTNQTVTGGGTIMQETRTLEANFTLPSAPYYTHTAFPVTNTSSGNSIRFEWKNSETGDKVSAVDAPTYIFTTPGEKTISLVAYDAAGNSRTKEMTFNVEALALPQPAFDLPASVPAGKRVTFVNTTTPTEGCSFEWTMVGATVEKATSLHATALYTATGEYTVELKAKNGSGSAMIKKKIMVLEKAPEVDFTISDPVILKGKSVKFSDASLYGPSSWFWEISDVAHHDIYTTQNAEHTFNDPGIYTVSLTAGNIIGSHEKAIKRGVVVCNADAMTGLNFSSSDEVVTFNNPLNPAATKAFTFDWWMYPRLANTSTQHIGHAAEDLLMTVQTDGAFVVTLGNKVFSSEPGVVSDIEWHHYAAVFEEGVDPNYNLARVTVKVYKDGHHVTTLNIPGTWPTMPSKMSLGGSSAPMRGMIDEFRIWNKAMMQEEINAYANQPIADVAAAEANDKLALYYTFNQSGGDVQDATSNGNHGVRTGFGPDGDAWSRSLGVFSLSTTARTDISADHLTNYASPFLNDGEAVNANAPQYLGLLLDDQTSTWILENADETNGVVTGVCVDTENGGMMAIPTKENGFAGSVDDHKAYQTVTLPAGYYVFGAEPLEVYSESEDFIAVAAGKGLPNTADLKDKALAYTKLPNGEVAFSLYEETEVSLGLVVNKRGESTQHIKRFYLERKITNDDFTWTGIDNTLDASTSLKLLPVKGGISVTAAMPTTVRVYTPLGACVHSGMVYGTGFISLPSGIYIVNGQKCLVR